jgi:hypothetical protein
MNQVQSKAINYLKEKYEALKFELHLTTRVPHDKRFLSGKKINPWFCNKILSPISKEVGCKLSAVSVYVPYNKEDGKQPHIHSLLHSPDAFLESHTKTINDSMQKAHGKNAVITQQRNCNSVGYFCGHLVFQSGELHHYNRNLMS